MLKNGIAAAALIAATASVYAGGPEAPPPAYVGGAYVDVGLSRDIVFDKFRSDITQNTLNVGQDFTNDRQSFNFDSGARGWAGFVGFGYNYVWDNEWSLGLELFGDVSSANGRQVSTVREFPITGQINTNYIDLRAKYTLGVSFIPGYFVAPGSLYFLELGYVNTEFAQTGFPAPVAGQFGNNPALLDNSLGANPSAQVNRSGFRLGFGTNTQVGSHVAIREEYVWETYGNFSTRRDFVVTNIPNQTLVTNSNLIRVSPNISKFNLAAVYYFTRQDNAPDLNSAPAHVGGNFYAGLNGSYDEFYSQAQYRIDSTQTNDATGLLVNQDYLANKFLATGTGWNIGLIGGYGWNFSNRWYLGTELFGDYDNVEARSANPGTLTNTTINGVTTVLTRDLTARLQKQWDFGAALIPGYQVSDHALLYARIGYVGANFNIKNFWSGLTGRTPAENALLSYSRSKCLNGLQLGVGVDTLVYENLSLRTEFNINNYGNYSEYVGLTPIRANGTTTNLRHATIYRHIIEDQFNVALIWHFFA